MKAKSQAQQKAAGAALAAKRGENKRSDLKGASLEMYDTMTEEELGKWPQPHMRGCPNSNDCRPAIGTEPVYPPNFDRYVLHRSTVWLVYS